MRHLRIALCVAVLAVGCDLQRGPTREELVQQNSMLDAEVQRLRLQLDGVKRELEGMKQQLDDANYELRQARREAEAARADADMLQMLLATYQ